MNHIEFHRGAIDASGCISDGWNLVKQNYGLFLGITLVAMLLVACIPCVNIFIAGPVTAGVYYCFLKEMYGENGVLVDRTTNRFTDGNGQRFVCGNLNSLSLFILASNAAPTAATVSISGRVLISNGRGLRNAVVSMTDANGNSRTTRTSSFGYYRFDEIAAGQTVIVNVQAKQFQFEPRILSISEDVTDVDFIPIGGDSLLK